MKTALFTVLALAVAVNASAATKLTFSHVKMKSEAGSATEKKLGSFDIDFIQIAAAPGQKLSPAQIKVNQLMREEAKNLPCGVGAEGTDDLSNQSVFMKSNVTFISPRLLAISRGLDTDCGGAHPDSGSISKIFDLETAQEIDIRTGKAPNYDSPTATQKAVDAVIMAAMKAQAKKEIASLGADDECSQTYSDLSFYTTDISLTPKALIVQNDEPHVSMACQFKTTIPLTAFSKVAPKGSLLAELAAGAAKLKK